MKKIFYPALLLLVILLSCEDDDNRVFDKSADERAAEAIANLKQELVAPTNGWIIKYRPQEGAGAYYVLLDFDENNKVVIRTDLGAENGQYFRDTISYRVDNSMGLELILENYSFFSFLFEQDQATFGAEYEFDFVNKTPDNALVFRSKSDIGEKDIILLEVASPDDVNLLGTTLASNLNILADDLDKFTSSLRLSYASRDLTLYISLDELRRTLTITSASLKSNTAITQSVDFSTGYIIEGEQILLDEPFEATLLGSAISISSLQLNTLSESSLAICADPITIHTFTGMTSAGANVTLETSLIDVSGKSFATLSDFYFTPLVYIFDNGSSASAQINQDIPGALELHMYYGSELNDGSILYGIGFVIRNADGDVGFALREFTPVLNDNNLVFNFAPDVSFFGADLDPSVATKVNQYLNELADGDKTYVFKIQDNVYEFYNPCTGWSFVFINANQ